MKALTFHTAEDIHYEDVIDPKIEKPTDAIVKINCTAICGSDLHVYYAREKGIDPGTVMGHEFVGEVIELGSKVKNINKGDIVFSPFTTNCGNCFYCKIGLTSRCEQGQLFGWIENGHGLHGVQAEYVRVPLAATTLQVIPQGISVDEALLLGDILSTGYFCADMAEIIPQGTYVVIGCGPVGLMAIIGALELKAQNIYAIDSIPERLEQAQKLGAIPLNYQQQDIIAIIKNATHGRGADSILEVVGNSSALKTAIALVRPGGIISSVGAHTENHFPFSPVDSYNKNLTYKIGRCPARDYMDKLIPLVQQKKYDFTNIISHRFSLSEGVEGYRIFANKLDNCTKVVLQP